jgi:hypothetical protein
LYDGFQAIGYEPRAILYLRPQADYLESLYAELITGGWPIEFEDFRSTIATTGQYNETEFDYDRLTLTFEHVFGPQRLRIRSYRAAAPSEDLLAEFIQIICEGRDAIDICTLECPGRLNQKANFDQVLHARSQQIAAAATGSPSSPLGSTSMKIGNEPFAPLTLFNVLENAVRFWPSNARIYRRYGVSVAGVTWATLSREIVTTLVGGAARRRKTEYLSPPAAIGGTEDEQSGQQF